MSGLVSGDSTAVLAGAPLGEGGVVLRMRRNSHTGQRRIRKRMRARNSSSGGGRGGGLLIGWLNLWLILGLAAVRSSALLNLKSHPDSITNKRTATFEYGCTPLDVAEGDTCGVEVRKGQLG